MVFMRGEKGLGKSEVIHRFLQQQNKVIVVSPDKSNESYLSSFETSLIRFYEKSGMNTDEPVILGLSHDEAIINRFFDALSDDIVIIYIRNIEQCSCEFIEFLQEICIHLYKNPQKRAFIIIEQDTNHEDSINNKDKIQNLFSISPLVEFINFRPISRNEMLDVFLSIFERNIKIQQRDADYLIESSSGNISILFIVVNYLKQEEIIFRDGGEWICITIPEGILSNILKKYIKQKYDQLDEHLKRTLQQSSLLGRAFATKQLKDTFSLLQADEWLSNIERISSLIKKDTNNNNYIVDYVFENDEIYVFVKNQIPKESIKVWFDTLIAHYQFLYDSLESKNSHSISLIGELVNLSIKIASYRAENGEHREALDFFVKAIAHCFTIMNYRQARLMIERAKQSAIFLKESGQQLFWLDKRYALCFEYLGLYEIAKDYFASCLNEYYHMPNCDTDWFRYKVAFCTYYSSLVDDAFELTYKLKKDIERNSRIDNLYYEVLSLLATLYNEKSDADKTLEYYLLSLDECKANSFDREYYIQLRKAGLCFDDYHLIPKLMEPRNYFDATGDRKEYSKATHNLGVSHLFICDWDNAHKALHETLTSFNSFASIEALYPLNALGILTATQNDDVSSALSYFQKADYAEMNAFKKITIWLNQSMCYQKLDDKENAWCWIEKCQELPHMQINKEFAYYRRTLYIVTALYYKHFGDYSDCLDWFKKCLEVSLENDQLFFVIQNIFKISNTLNLPIDEDTRSFFNSEISHMPIVKVFLEKDMFFHELRFLE